MQNQNKSNLYVFLLYINVIISYYFKVEFAIIKSEHSMVNAILEITQDALSVVAVQVQTRHLLFLSLNMTKEFWHMENRIHDLGTNRLILLTCSSP